MYSPEVQVEPFMDSQSGSPPVSPTVQQREGYFPSAEPSAPSPWQRRSSVSTSDQPRPVFESLARSPGTEALGPPLKEGQISSPPPHSYPLPPSPTQTTTKPLGGGAARRLSRASAKSIDRQSFLAPSSPPTLQQPIPTSPIRAQPPTLPTQETPASLPPGSRNLPPRTPPHAALASPPLSSTLSSSRRTSGSSVDRITPPSSSSSLASIPGLGPAQFSGGLTPDLSNPYRSQMERPLDTVKRLSRQVERRDYTRGAPSAGGPSSYRTEDMFASSEMSNKSSHSPTPSTHSAPPFVMSGAYPSAMNGAYPSLSMNGAYPSALAMSGPYPTRGSHLSSFDNPWPTWDGPSPSAVDAKLASKKARRMSSAPNNQEGDRRKQSQSEHGSSATRTKSHGKEREHLSPNGSPILGGNTYSPSPLSQASSPVATPAGSPGLSSPPPPVPTVTLDRSGSKKKKRLSMWGRSKPEDEPPLPTTPTKKDLLAVEDSRSRTVSAPAKSTSSAAIPPVPAVPATISSPRSTSNSRSKPNSPSRAPPLAPIITSELAPPPTNPSSPSSSTTTTTTPQQPSHHHNGGLLSHFGSHKGGRKSGAPKSAPPSPKKLAPPGPPPPVVAPVLSSKSRKVSRDMALRDEAKEEKGLGGLWKRLSMSKKGKGHASPTEGAAATAEEKDASRMASKPNGSALGHRVQQESSKPPLVADVVVAPASKLNGAPVGSPARAPPSAPAPPPPPPPPATPERNHPHHVVPTPSSSGSSSSTTTARAARPSRPQDPRVSPSPPSLVPAVGSRQQNISRSRSPTRPPPNEPLPPTPPTFYGSTEVGASPSPPKPLRGLPSPPRGNPENHSNHSLPANHHSSADPIPHSSTFPNIRQLPHLPTTLSAQQSPPNFSRRGASYDPPSSPSQGEGHDYSDILARSVSHPSRPPTPPSKESFVGHELAQTSSSSAGSEGSRGGIPMWEPRTAGSSFTVYTAAGSEDSEGVKV